MSGNYPWIIRGFTSENYHLVYHHAEKWRFIGILAHPNIILTCTYAAFLAFMTSGVLRRSGFVMPDFSRSSYASKSGYNHTLRQINKQMDRYIDGQIDRMLKNYIQSWLFYRKDRQICNKKNQKLSIRMYNKDLIRLEGETYKLLFLVFSDLVIFLFYESLWFHDVSIHRKR